ncbi:MAG: AraC family transcriptional regulator [Caulobacterales bacterium]|nr:AraC family transcriptional regulator [Caulobacterales bacterium]
MADSLTLIDMFVRGLAAGAMAVMALAIWRSAVARAVRLVGLALGISTICWLICESHPLWSAFGDAYVLALLSMPVGGLFWLFVIGVFEDQPITPWRLAPALVLLASGAPFPLGSAPEALWLTRNVLSGILAVHAGLVIARGWRGDLVESRRRVRGALLGLVSLYVVMEVAVSILHRLDPGHPWLIVSVGEPLGGAIIAALILAMAVLFLQARASLFEPARRVEAAQDPRGDAADRAALERLQARMAAEGWRREGLTIGALAEELALPEHRLRRLINQRLGHRNFADFVNSYRIEAAKRRLADPGDARTTVAAIAFDLGYGSLGPFNRAFRAATGLSPTEWRRAELARTSPKLSEAV